MAEAAADLSFSVDPVQPLARSPTPLHPVVRPRASNGLLSASVSTPQESLTPQPDRVGRAMVIGGEISVSGAINFCDRLVVEGTVEASVHECRQFIIAATGRFRANACTADADIGGRFMGDLVVRQRLTIRAGAHVSGTVTYSEIEIEPGGKVSGILMQESQRSVVL